MAEEKITSKDNARLKHVRGVRDGRAAGGEIYIEGVRLAAEALRSPVRVTAAFVSDAAADNGEIGDVVRGLAAKGTGVLTVAEKVFSTITDTVNSQGLILLAERPANSLDRVDIDAAEVPLIVHLQKVNNPSNLGAVVRTAEAAGAAAVLVSKGSADPFSPKAVRASMGSCFRLPVVSGMTLDEAVAWADENSITTAAADLSGDIAYTETDPARAMLVVFGSEANGLSREELALVSQKINIPMANGVESLNLAVSTGIILFEARRRSLT